MKKIVNLVVCTCMLFSMMLQIPTTVFSQEIITIDTRFSTNKEYLELLVEDYYQIYLPEEEEYTETSFSRLTFAITIAEMNLQMNFTDDSRYVPAINNVLDAMGKLEFKPLRVVTFESDGGSLVEAQLVKENSPAVLPEEPIKIGYTFQTWYADSDLTMVYDFSTPVTQDITLYAEWEKEPLPSIKEHSVTFESNGGSLVDAQLVEENVPAVIPLVPTKVGYTFQDWYVDSDLTTVYDFSTLVTQDITLYAKWIKKPSASIKEYQVTFESNGGSLVDAQLVKENDSVDIPAVPTKTDYLFKGWYVDSDLTTAYDFSSPVTEEITLYAKWEKERLPSIKEYPVTFESNGGSAVASQTVKENELAIQPEFPKKEGAIFVGWYSDEDLTQPFDFNTPITQATVVYASWLMNDEPMPMYTIPVYYQNEKGETLSETVLLSGAKGEAYQAEQKIIPGYVLKEVIGEPSGKFGFEGLLSFRSAEMREKRTERVNTSSSITYVYKKELPIEKNDKPKVNKVKKNTQKNQTSSSKKQKTLPKTGERVTLSLSTMGMFLLLIVSYIIEKKKRNKI